MAITTGTALTRELSSNSSSGLQRLVAGALEDNIGYDREGGIQRTGGTNQQSTIDFKWRGSVQETKQTIRFNYASVENSLLFNGSATTRKKIQSVSFSGAQQLHSSTSRIKITIGGITGSLVTHDSRVSATEAADYTRQLLQQSKFSSVIDSVSVAGTTLHVTYKLAAGDISFPSEVTLVSGAETAVFNTFTTAATTTTSFRTATHGATASVSVVYHIGNLGIQRYTETKTIATGGSFNGNDLAILIETLVRDQRGIESSFFNGASDLRFTLASGYSVSNLSLRLTVARDDGVTVSHDITSLTTGTGTVAHVAGIPETFGTCSLKVSNPATGNVHGVDVVFEQDEAITDVENKIRTAIQNSAIDVEGNTVGSFLQVSVNTPTDGTDNASRDVHLFKVTLDWTDPGSATVTVDDSQMTDIGTDFSSVTPVVTGAGVLASDRIVWDHLSTSATLQPGGETTHYATLTYLQR